MNVPREQTLQQLADLVGGSVAGDPQLVVCGLNGIEQAGPGEITFLLDARHLPLPEGCRASACIVPTGCGPLPLSTIVTDQPAVAAACIHAFLLEQPFAARGVHPSAVVGSDCRIPEQVSVGPLVCLGDRVVLGERVTIHPGAVIGSDGFGFATDNRGNHYRKPQVGTVRIDDDVEIGANACVDRAAFGTTWVQAGTKMDNLVMVGHNVVVGANSILVAQTGIAGSTTLGRNVVLGAKAGVAGHLHIGDRVMAAAMSGIHNDQPAGAIVGGTPAFEAKAWARAAAAFSRLPELVRESRRLRREVDRLSALLEQAGQPNGDKK